VHPIDATVFTFIQHNEMINNIKYFDKSIKKYFSNKLIRKVGPPMIWVNKWLKMQVECKRKLRSEQMSFKRALQILEIDDKKRSIEQEIHCK